MKKLLICLSLILVTFCSCGEQKVDAGLDKSVFFTQFSAEYNGINIEGNFSQSDDGAYKITLTKPETLNDFSVAIKDDKLTLLYKGIEKELDISKVPESSIITSFVKAVDEFTSKSAPMEKTDNGYLLETENYKLETDENLKPKQLIINTEPKATINFK